MVQLVYPIVNTAGSAPWVSSSLTLSAFLMARTVTSNILKPCRQKISCKHLMSTNWRIMPNACLCAMLLDCLLFHFSLRQGQVITSGSWAMWHVIQLHDVLTILARTSDYLRILSHGKPIMIVSCFHSHFAATRHCSMQSSLTLYKRIWKSIKHPVNADKPQSQ